MKTTKNFVTFFILSFPFLKYNELHSQGWNACMDAPEYCGSGGSGKSIGEQVEWWQSILIIIVVSLIIYQIFKKLDSTPIKVTVGIIGGLIIFSAITKEVWGVVIPAWMVISYIMWKMSGSPDLEKNDSSYDNVHKKQANKPRVIKKEEHSGSWKFTFKANYLTDQLTVEKGSISINGVSLTVVNTVDKLFSVAIIPYTYEHTTFNQLSINDKVNIEPSIVARTASTFSL